MSLSGSKKKKEAITDDAELAEFVRQHPELSQYIKDLQQARNDALKNAQEGKQTGLESAANLNAKLDVIATLLEGSPIAPSLRMGDTVAKEAFIAESKKAFDDPDEGAALAEHVWNRAQEKLQAAELKRSEEIKVDEKLLGGKLESKELARIAALLSTAEGPEAVRQLRNTLESNGVNVKALLDPSTPEGAAFRRLAEKSSSPELAHRLEVLLFAAELRSDCHETSAKLASEKAVDRLLAMSAEDRAVVDSYFKSITQKSADRYLLEAYMGVRGYAPDPKNTTLRREPTENAEAIVSKLVLRSAAADGQQYKFQNGETYNEGIFRSTIEKIFETKFGTRPSEHEICKKMGGIQNLDRFDYSMRMFAVSAELQSLTSPNVELAGRGLAEYRANILANIAPIALSTDRQTKVNLTPQFLHAIESMPTEERVELAAAFKTRTGLSLEQAVRSYTSAPLAETTIQSMSALISSDAAHALERLDSVEVGQSSEKLRLALEKADPAQLSSAAKEFHSAINAQGVSVQRALEGSLDEAKALDAYLQAHLKDEGLVRQTKALLFAVELEQQAGPQSLTLPSQSMVGRFLSLPKEDKALVETYFKASANSTAERYLFEAFSGIQNYAALNSNSSEKRAAREDAKQIVAALLISSAAQRGEPMTLTDGQLSNPYAAIDEIAQMYSGDDTSPAQYQYVMKEKLPQFSNREELSAICRQGLLIRSMQELNNGATDSDPAQVDRRNAALLASNLQGYLGNDSYGGGSLASSLITSLGNLSPERLAGLRSEYQAQTGKDLVADIRAGMKEHTPAQIDYISNTAALLLGRDDFERRAGFIGQSVAKAGKLSPQTFADLMQGLDASGCLQGNPQSIETFNKTIAAYESSTGETFAALLERNSISPKILEAIRNGDKASIDAFNVRATYKGSEAPLQGVSAMLGGQFNLNAHPEIAAAYEKNFGEKFGDVREELTRQALKDADAADKSMRRTVDMLRKGNEREIADLEKSDLGFLAKGFYIWDGAAEAQANTAARNAADALRQTEIYAEKHIRLQTATSLTEEGSQLLKQVAELQKLGRTEEAAALDKQATMLLLKAQGKIFDATLPNETLEVRIKAAQSAAQEHAKLVEGKAPAAQIEAARLIAKSEFETLVKGPWGPNQTTLVRDAIKNILTIDPSLDPRQDSKADRTVLNLISNSRSTGFLDEVPAAVLTITEKEREQLDKMNLVGVLRQQQERDIIEGKRSQFTIEAEFHRNRMRPVGERNLGLLEYEARYEHRRNMAEFQREWAEVMQNFDRTETQLKTIRTGVLVVGAIATGGATAGLAAGSGAGTLTTLLTAYQGVPTIVLIAAASHGTQAIGDVSLGNKSGGEAFKAFVNEGGKDMLNVAMAGGMGQLMQVGKIQGLLKAANESGGLVTRLAVAGSTGTTFAVGMEGSNIAFDSVMYQVGASQHKVTGSEVADRLTTAAAMGWVGGSIGGGAGMLRQGLSGPQAGKLAMLGRNAVGVVEYGAAGYISQYELHWDGAALSVRNHGFDGLSAAIAVGSTYAGNRAANAHTSGEKAGTSSTTGSDGPLPAAGPVHEGSPAPSAPEGSSVAKPGSGETKPTSPIAVENQRPQSALGDDLHIMKSVRDALGPTLTSDQRTIGNATIKEHTRVYEKTVANGIELGSQDLAALRSAINQAGEARATLRPINLIKGIPEAIGDLPRLFSRGSAAEPSARTTSLEPTRVTNPIEAFAQWRGARQQINEILRPLVREAQKLRVENRLLNTIGVADANALPDQAQVKLANAAAKAAEVQVDLLNRSLPLKLIREPITTIRELAALRANRGVVREICEPVRTQHLIAEKQAHITKGLDDSARASLTPEKRASLESASRAAAENLVALQRPSVARDALIHPLETAKKVLETRQALASVDSIVREAKAQPIVDATRGRLADLRLTSDWRNVPLAERTRFEASVERLSLNAGQAAVDHGPLKPLRDLRRFVQNTVDTITHERIVDHATAHTRQEKALVELRAKNRIAAEPDRDRLAHNNFDRLKSLDIAVEREARRQARFGDHPVLERMRHPIEALGRDAMHLVDSANLLAHRVGVARTDYINARGARIAVAVGGLPENALSNLSVRERAEYDRGIRTREVIKVERALDSGPLRPLREALRATKETWNNHRIDVLEKRAQQPLREQQELTRAAERNKIGTSEGNHRERIGRENPDRLETLDARVAREARRNSEFGSHPIVERLRRPIEAVKSDLRHLVDSAALYVHRADVARVEYRTAYQAKVAKGIADLPAKPIDNLSINNRNEYRNAREHRVEILAARELDKGLLRPLREVVRKADETWTNHRIHVLEARQVQAARQQYEMGVRAKQNKLHDGQGTHRDRIFNEDPQKLRRLDERIMRESRRAAQFGEHPIVERLRSPLEALQSDLRHVVDSAALLAHRVGVARVDYRNARGAQIALGVGALDEQGLTNLSRANRAEYEARQRQAIVLETERKLDSGPLRPLREASRKVQETWNDHRLDVLEKRAHQADRQRNELRIRERQNRIEIGEGSHRDRISQENPNKLRSLDARVMRESRRAAQFGEHPVVERLRSPLEALRSDVRHIADASALFLHRMGTARVDFRNARVGRIAFEVAGLPEQNLRSLSLSDRAEYNARLRKDIVIQTDRSLDKGLFRPLREVSRKVQEVWNDHRIDVLEKRAHQATRQRENLRIREQQNRLDSGEGNHRDRIYHDSPDRLRSLDARVMREARRTAQFGEHPIVERLRHPIEALRQDTQHLIDSAALYIHRKGVARVEGVAARVQRVKAAANLQLDNSIVSSAVSERVTDAAFRVSGLKEHATSPRFILKSVTHPIDFINAIRQLPKDLAVLSYYNREAVLRRSSTLARESDHWHRREVQAGIAHGESTQVDTRSAGRGDSEGGTADDNDGPTGSGGDGGDSPTPIRPTGNSPSGASGASPEARASASNTVVAEAVEPRTAASPTEPKLTETAEPNNPLARLKNIDPELHQKIEDAEVILARLRERSADPATSGRIREFLAAEISEKTAQYTQLREQASERLAQSPEAETSTPRRTEELNSDSRPAIDPELRERITSRKELIARLEQDFKKFADKPQLQSVIEESLTAHRAELSELEAQATAHAEATSVSEESHGELRSSRRKTNAEESFEEYDPENSFLNSQYDEDGNFKSYDPSESFAAELEAKGDDGYSDPLSSGSSGRGSSTPRPSDGGGSGGGTMLQEAPTRVRSSMKVQEPARSNPLEARNMKVEERAVTQDAVDLELGQSIFEEAIAALTAPETQAAPMSAVEIAQPENMVVDVPETYVTPAPIRKPAQAPQIIDRPEVQLGTKPLLQNVEAVSGQLLGRISKPVTRLDLREETQLELSRAYQPQPKPEFKNPTETATNKATERRREGRAGHSPDEEKKHYYEHTEKERKKHIAELSRSEKKGGAKLRFTHLVDELGDEDLVIETEETGG
ncbi:MAG: hypothetical protein J0M12_04380 [Deltaproteobacteria bacterium]|nr:hypothetical protein [Deltaproteobacteria bacterium]